MILLALVTSAAAILALGMVIGIWLADERDEWHDFQEAAEEMQRG